MAGFYQICRRAVYTIGERWWIAAVLVIAVVGSFLLSSEREPAWDDLMYTFVFADGDFKDPLTLRQIDTFADVWESQCWHYLHFNGRAPVHILIQVFAGLWGYTIWGIFNAVAFTILLILIIYCAVPDKRTKPWYWLSVLVAMFYFFPGFQDTPMAVWFSIAPGVNYLWSAVLFITTLLLLRRWHGKCGVSYKCLIAVVIGLLTGWSNEAYSIPLSAAFFLYCACVRRKFPHGLIRVLMISVFVGTALLVFAPGTIERFRTNMDAGGGSMLFSLVMCYMGIKLLWMLIAVMVFGRLTGKMRIRSYMRDNIFLWIVLVTGILFSVIAHTSPHSLTCVELTSLLLILRAIASWQIHSVRIQLIWKSVSIILYICVLTTVGIHLSAIVVANTEINLAYRAQMSEFLSSCDGIIHQLPEETNPWLRPFVNDYNMHLTPEFYTAAMYAVEAGCPGKMPLSLSDKDYAALVSNPDSFFSPANEAPGSAHMYLADQYYVSPGIPHSRGRVMAYYDDGAYIESLPWYLGLYSKLFVGKKRPKELMPQIVYTRHGPVTIIEKPLSLPSYINIVGNNY